MAKCVRCGKSLLLAGKQKLKDGNQICKSCFEALGYDWTDKPLAKEYYTWDLIKNGKAAHQEHNRKLQEEFRKANPGLMEALSNDYDEEDETPKYDANININLSVTSSLHKELNETDGEAEIFDIITKMFPDDNLFLKRKSNDYVTVMYGEWDIVRIKYNDRAQWVMFPTIEAKQRRHHLDSVSEIEDYEAAIKESINHAKKYE